MRWITCYRLEFILAEYIGYVRLRTTYKNLKQGLPRVEIELTHPFYKKDL